MDESKDLQRTDDISKTLDARSIRTNPFGRNISGERAYRRAERLVAAIHILTSHVAADEPARKKARYLGINLLSTILDLRDEMRSPGSASHHASLAIIRELISLIRIQSLAGFLSLQNTNAMTEALDELGNFLLASQRTGLSESTSFTKDELLDIRDVGNEHIVRVGDRSAQTDVLKDKDALKDTSRTSDRRMNTAGLDTRAQAVVEVLRSRGEIGIKDISANLPEYSEKMIQRELARLIAGGRVKKTGFKRWSRYALVR